MSLSYIQWDAHLTVGVSIIDEQHQKLVGIVNELYDNMKLGKTKDIMGKILGELINYTVYHFQTEENLFKNNNYPDMAAHMKEHSELTKKALDIKAKFENGTLLISVELLDFLKKWLNDHILSTDKKAAKFLNEKGIS